MNIEDLELRRRVNANLAALRDGTVARQKEAEKAARAQLKEQLKQTKKRWTAAKKELAKVEAEYEGLKEYLDEMLENEEHWKGGIEETDHAIEGCLNEIYALKAEIDTLEELYSQGSCAAGRYQILSRHRVIA